MKLTIQGQGDVNLTQRDFVAAGGHLLTRAAMRYDAGHDVHFQIQKTRQQDLQEMRGSLPHSGPCRRAGKASGESGLLPGVLALWRTQGQPLCDGPRKGRPRQDMSQLREDLLLHGKDRQQGAPQEPLQYLSDGERLSATESESDCVQGREVQSLRVRQVPQRFVLPSSGTFGEARHHLPVGGTLLGTVAPRVGQVRVALSELPCRSASGDSA